MLGDPDGAIKRRRLAGRGDVHLNLAFVMTHPACLGGIESELGHLRSHLPTEAAFGLSIAFDDGAGAGASGSARTRRSGGLFRAILALLGIAWLCGGDDG